VKPPSDGGIKNTAPCLDKALRSHSSRNLWKSAATELTPVFFGVSLTLD